MDVVQTANPALPLPRQRVQATPRRSGDPRWVRPALLGLMLATGVLYLWGLSASGWANGFYSAAAQAASRSWKAFFFGSFDAANAITVDKTPASLWVMGISVRIFGLSSWSILVPQALEGVATVGLVYLTVRRALSAPAGLIAAAVTALTPVAVLMFRFNNPDALLVLLLVGAAYAMVRAQERAETRWLVLAGVLVGFGFLAKMLQALLVIPAFALAYLITAPTPFLRRLRQAFLAVATVLVAGGWWVAIVELWPAASRPYIGGSQTNSVLNLMFGYNGFGRINGNETGSVVGGGGPGNAGAWGNPGWTRMFGSEVGTQVAWLIPAALILLVVGLWWTRRSPRTDRLRSSYLLWGTWLILTGLLFSFMEGIFHPYYTVALAPAIGALIGLGVTQAWERRHHPGARAALAVVLAATGVWSWMLLRRTPGWLPWLRSLALVGAITVMLAILVVHRLPRSVTVGVATLSLLVGLTGSAAYAVDTASSPHGGALPTAGPSGAVSNGFRPGGTRFGGFRSTGGFPPIPNGGRPPAAASGFGGVRGFALPGFAAGGSVGNPGGLLDTSQPGSGLVDLLEAGASGFTWVAATVGANSAAGYQLATQLPVMAIGGFNGTDPWPSLQEFQQMVQAGEIHYFIAGGRGFGRAGTATQIASWVEGNFGSVSVDGVAVYDLSRTG